MILKITDLENYTQFINTQPLYKLTTEYGFYGTEPIPVNPALPEGEQLVQADAFEAVEENIGLPNYVTESY
ncbi:hypothetical protein [Phenylobacterium sp.]|uniref:hypothetical protein n=1 Tax=Phenylobacterium sp. TaxID=1871053 RepID=UPI0025D54373|nr:hypothetical protein [Phenylobacterium sp.]